MGRALKKLRPDWEYLRSSDADLSDPVQALNILRATGPDVVVHLARRRRGGEVQRYEDDTMMNVSVLRSCRMLGVRRLIVVDNGARGPVDDAMDAHCALLGIPCLRLVSTDGPRADDVPEKVAAATGSPEDFARVLEWAATAELTGTLHIARPC